MRLSRGCRRRYSFFSTAENSWLRCCSEAKYTGLSEIVFKIKILMKYFCTFGVFSIVFQTNRSNIKRSKNLQCWYRGLKNNPPLKVQKASFQKVFRGVFFSKSESRKCQGRYFYAEGYLICLWNPYKTLKILQFFRALRESYRGVYSFPKFSESDRGFYCGGYF